jgi:transposase
VAGDGTHRHALRLSQPCSTRERVVIEPPTTCACCGGSRLSKLGEDATLEDIPRRFKLIETVRE